MLMRCVLSTKFKGNHCNHRVTSTPQALVWSSMRVSDVDGDCILLCQSEASRVPSPPALSRTKFAAVVAFVFMSSLFLTFHVLYDSAITANGLYLDYSADFPSSRVRFPRTSRRLPQTIIIGVRKCGTRALLEMLFLHPQIQKAAGEVHFFDKDDNYHHGLEWYRKKMPHSFKDQITIEKSPSYFVTPEVPERIRAMNSSIKLLLIVREPVTRAISDYTQIRSHGSGRGAASHQQFEQLAINPDGSVNIQYRPISISIYHHFLQKWLDVFLRGQMLIVNGDRLIENPVVEIEKIEEFLGIEKRITKDNFYFNKTKGFYCLRNETMEKCLKDSKGRKHPDVNPAVISKLRRFFSEHNQKFYELVGEDFGWPER